MASTHSNIGWHHFGISAMHEKPPVINNDYSIHLLSPKLASRRSAERNIKSLLTDLYRDNHYRLQADSCTLSKAQIDNFYFLLYNWVFC